MKNTGENEKRITLRLPEELHEKLVREAKKNMRSLNSQIVMMLTEATPQASREK